MIAEELRQILTGVLAVASSLLATNALLLLAIRGLRAHHERRLRRSERIAAPLLTAFDAGEATADETLAALRALPRSHAARLVRRQARFLAGDSLERLRGLYAAMGQPARDSTRLRSRRFWRRLDALEGFAYFAYDGDPKDLARHLADRRDSVRVAATRALARVGDEAALRFAFGALGDVSRLGLIELIHTVSSGGALAARVLAERLAGTADPMTRRQGAELAWQAPAPDLLPVLLRFAETSDLELVIRTARALSSFHDDRALIALRRLLGHAQWQVRAQAAKSLGHLGDRESAMELMRAVGDPSWWVRYNSAVALKGLGPIGEGRLRRLRGGPDRYASEMAERVLRFETEAQP